MSLLAIYEALLARYGPQGWWPADSPFEVMLGAILTQNTNWRNVEKAIANLKGAGMLDAAKIAALAPDRLAELIRSAGFFRQKAARIQRFCRFYLDCGGEAGLKRLADPREALLALNGIGPETADSILLYALQHPVFVVDAYTRRIFARLGLTDAKATYARLQAYFEARLPRDARLFNEYHALIVAHAKQHCRAEPICRGCPLRPRCRTAASPPPGRLR